MKQSPETVRHLISLVLVLISLLTACGRLPRSASHTTTFELPAPSTTKPGPVNINIASAVELEKLPGVGPTLAQRIITYRETHGRFRRAEHLMMVRGISDRRFRELRSRVKVD